MSVPQQRSTRRLIQIEAPSVTKHIARTLGRYPDGGQILKELIQNADDAEATEVKFILDTRQYPSHHIINPALSQFQGPSLYAWNNAVFKDKDWDYFGKMEDSSKEKDALKVGRFGVGFLSVFHITDLPMVLSTDTAAILDPHKKYTGTDRRGWSSTLSDFLSYSDHAACFASLGSCSVPQGTLSYPATIFRFPLRLPGAASEISTNSYSPDRVRNFLYGSFLKEAPIILLFLKHVEEISLYDGDTCLYKVSIHPEHKKIIRAERNSLIETGLSKPSIPFLSLYSMTTCVYRNTGNQNDQYHWLIFNMIGTTFDDVKDLSQNLQVLPWVGIAAPLPSMLTFHGIRLVNVDMNRLSGVLLNLQSQLKCHTISLPWNGNNLTQGAAHKGHAFCFLPLPDSTHLPVHIHGYFSISDNRRSIEWPSADNESDKAVWNNMLVLKHIAPLYAIMISCRSQLITYKGTPLLACNTDQGITDPYIAWPLFSEVKHMQIWSELVNPTVQNCVRNPVFWSMNGKWVTADEALFLPKSSSIPSKALEILVHANVAIVSLPNDLWQTIEMCFRSRITEFFETVSPTHVRNAIKRTKSSFKSNEDLLPVLEYCLSDLMTRGNYNELEGLNMISLATPHFRSALFSSIQHHLNSIVYVLNNNNRRLYDVLPGVQASFASISLMTSSSVVEKSFISMASRSLFQLRIPTPLDVCKHLLPQSIKSWAPAASCHNQRITYTPGRGNHPPVIWIAALWEWLRDNPSVLPNTAGLPILPQDIVNEGTTSCVLLPIPSGDTKYYVSQDGEDYIVPLFEKLGAVTLKQNGFVFMHKRIKDFILQATIPNLLTHLAKLGLSKIHNLNTADKNLLRRLIAHYYFQNQLPSNLQKLVIRLPIFEAGVGSSTIKLTSLEGGRLILPPQEMLFSPHLSYPPDILKNSESYLLISRRLNYTISTQDDVLLAILSFAINECHTATQWSNGDNVILWVMTVYPKLSARVKTYLNGKAFVRTNLNSLKNPKELYSSADQQFHKLFNGNTDDVFPCDLYIQYGVLNTLVQLGLQTWPSIVQNQQSFAKFLADRAKTVISLSREEGFKRSCFIMELIGLHSNQRNVHIVNELKFIKFLSVQLTPPNNFPCTGLPWHGKEYTNKLESLDKICYNIDSSTGIAQYINTNTQYLVCGSVLPVLSSDYGKSMSVQLPLVVVQSFLQPKVGDVIQQLSILIKAFPEIPPTEIPKIDCMVKAMYDYLNTTSSPFDLPRQWIWSNIEQGTYKFMMAERFVLSSKLDLSPFIFSIMNTTYLLQYRQLLQKGQICSSPSCDKLVETLHGIKTYVNDSPLPDKFLKMSIDILLFIEQQKHPSIGDVLLPTVDLTLRPASECTFDDREWNRKPLTNQSQSFLHHSIPAAVAKYFGVEGLSQKVAPSKKLKINYIQLGQKESLTRKLRGIVNDYSGNIDVFKEVIQNADDAGASEVKFVLDYRQHGTGSLFNNGMKQWQGTAVLAYNNAVFSDQDFENICNLAAQTKMEDPLKIGRFGVGFCACYSLTDVPSFISRRNLSIFDPHTKFLGDRVSRNEPGMRLDLVTEKADLQEYCDQLAPYDGVFGCNVFDLADEGFNGTIFRFPIRTKANSEICKETYSDLQIKFMMDRLEKEAQTLLIFLKHISQLEVYMLDRKATKVSEMKLLFKIEKNCNKLNPRVQMIKNYHMNPNHVQRPLSDRITISVTKQKEQKCDVHCFVLASAISPYSEETKKGMVPMAELAIKINNSGGICIPEPDTNSMLFCFLPLPLQSSLPFHVNGYFDVGKDRRGLRDAQDSKEYTWNRFLIRMSLPMAFEYALHCIASHFNPSPNVELKVKKRFLNNYYSLWPGASHVIRQTGWISSEFSDSVKSLLSKYTQPILWSDKAITGSWVPIAKVCLFKNSNAIQDDIKKDAIRLLQQHGYQIVNCPSHVYELLSPIATRNGQIIDYEAFFKICFISNLAKFPKETRDKHLKFVLESCEKIPFIQDGGQFNWTKEVLSNNQCIPVKGLTFAFPNQLISTELKHIADLFDVSEGRFIEDNYGRYNNVLVQLGMVNNELPLEELVKRAQTVQTLTEETVKARVVNIFNYIEHTYRSYSHQTSHDKNKLIAGLSRVHFLKPFSNPHSKFLPWYQTTSKPFYRPSELYHYQYLYLLFSQAPVFCLKDYTDALYTERLPSLLGINEYEPTVSMVLNNLCFLLQRLSNLEVELSETASTFINTAFETMYEFLSSQCRVGKAGEILKRLAHLNCIWQNNKLLHPSQVIWEGDIDCYPYLCSLSFSNRRFEHLFMVIRVEKSPSSKFLLNVLGRLKTTYGEKPLSKEHLDLVEFVSKKLAEVYNGANDGEAILPDEKGILRSCDKLSSDNIGSNQWVLNTPVFIEFIAKGGHFLHPSISSLTASRLGVRTLINAVLKDIEDHNFLNETDFCQYEDLVDRINGILKKYPPDISIFKEFIQNSDDAKASEIVFVLDCRVDHPTEKLIVDNVNWKSLQSVPALCIFNNRPFTDDDIKGICRLGRGSKGETSDTIGRFGIGFNVAYHLTDCPMFVSFDGKKSPTDFCVFDPLREYCSTSSKRGRRLKGSNGQLNSFPDQLSPFLFNCFDHMQKLVPSCFKDINEGFTVFRLPLKHADVLSNRKNYLREGQVHNANQVRQLLVQLMSSSEDMLLFLNHVKRLSAFEITETRTVLHYFSTQSMGLTNQPEQLQPISICKELCLTTIHQQTQTAPSKWIVHKQSGSSVKKVGGKGLLCDIAKKRGLEAVGGTATKVDYANAMKNGKLFCFLPLSIDSCLPVHLNGHFLIDDSRNHLDRATVGLENWNFDLAQNILVPSYVQLILKAKEYVTRDNEQSVRWFYNLFPNLLSNSVSAASTLKVNEQLYKYLLHENQSILLDHGQFLKGNVKWLQLNKGAIGKFYLNCDFKKRRIRVEEKIRGVLLSLGMLITCAPVHVFNGFCQVSGNSYATTSIVTPENVIDFLRNITINDESTKLILEHCIPILEFCLQDCFNEVMIQCRLKNTPILKNKANQIVRTTGVLYSSAWSHLLPNHINLFAHSSLETGIVGKKLREGFVIIDPPLDVIVKHIDLPDVNGPVTLADHRKELVKSLWNFLSRYESSNYSLIFKNKPIIPSSRGTFYPAKLQKCLFINSKGQATSMLSALQKLGYPCVDFNLISIPELPLFVTRSISNSSNPHDVIMAMNLLPPPSLTVELNKKEYSAFIYVLGHAEGIPKQVCTLLRQMRLFKTTEGTHCSIGPAQISRVIFVPEDVPLNGLKIIETSCKSVFLKSPNDSQDKFYNKVFTLHECRSARISLVRFYLELAVPKFELLSDDQVKAHLKVINKSIDPIGIISDDYRNQLITLMAQTPLITIEKKRYRVSDFYDPKNKFYYEFYQRKVLPAGDWAEGRIISLKLLYVLGLKVNVTHEEWLQVAQYVVNQWMKRSLNPSSKQSEYYHFVKRLDVLFKCFKDIIDKESVSESFLTTCSTLKFIHCPDTPKLEELLKRVVSWKPPKPFERFIEPSGAAFNRNQNLVCLSHPILPVRFDFLLNSSARTGLKIVEPITCDMVVDNLVKLSQAILSNNVRVCAPSQTRMNDVVELKRIFEEHYRFLDSRHKELQTTCKRLRTTPCFLISSDNLSLAMVPPSQLVKQLPKTASYEPFCIRLPTELTRYPSFLKAVGVKEELDAIDFITILLNIKKLMEDMNMKSLEGDEKLLSLCNYTYGSLVINLRKNTNIVISKDQRVVLPTIDYQLLDHTQLIYNDIAWIADYLGNQKLPFLLPPPRDANGQKIPPLSLQMQCLSKVAVQELSKCVLHPSNKCAKHELHLKNKKLQNCCLVRDLVESLESPHFKSGMERLYWHENQEHPSSNGKFCKQLETIMELNRRQAIHCVNTIQTIVIYKNVEVAQTEDNSHLCYISKDNGQQLKLFVTHGVAQFTVDQFLEQLAGQLKEVLGNFIKNELLIKSVLNCRPDFISQVLDTLKVRPFDSTISVSSDKSLSIGTTLSIKNLNFKKENLIIFYNYQIGEKVMYHCIVDNEPVLRIGKVVELVENKQHHSWPLNTDIKLSTSSSSQKPETTVVSFFHIYKELTLCDFATLNSNTHQSLYSTPLLVLPVPIDRQKIRTWLVTIINRNRNKQYCLMVHLRQRLLAHLHYYFMTTVCDHELYLFATNLLFELMSEDVDVLANISPKEKIEEIVEKLDKLSIEGDIDDHDMESDDDNDDEQTLLGHGYRDVAIQLQDTRPPSVSLSPSTRTPTPQAFNPSIINSLPVSGSGGTSTSHVGHSNAAPSRRFAQVQNTQLQQRYVQNVLPPKPVILTDPIKAKAWLSQAKVDYLAACDIFTNSVVGGGCVGESLQYNEVELMDIEESFKLIGTGTNTDEDPFRSNTADHRNGSADSPPPTQCKYPALVCFLSHEVVEKCLKGIMYAKCGLPRDLIECRNLNELYSHLAKSKKCPEDVKTCLQHSSISITGHEKKCRFPNHHHPTCAPAVAYSFAEAVEAMKVMNNLMKRIQESDMMEFIGELDTLPEADIALVLEKCITNNTDVPDFWDSLPGNFNLVLLDSEDNEEHSVVLSQFHTSLPKRKVLRIERIQNIVIWKKYTDCAKRMKENNNGRLSIMSLFHGTRTNPPDRIYKGDASFDMRFSNNGLWGKGNYFAVNASYSHNYSHKLIKGQQYQMLLAYVLTGYSFRSKQDGNLTRPPLRTAADGVQLHYDSVMGITSDSAVFITYNNDHAYPAYLITYR